MNIQGSSIRERRPVSQSDASHRLAMVFQVGILLITLAFMANTYIYLNQKISEADRAIIRLKSELAGVEREIESYRLQYETYSSWPHIREAIRRFNLPLRQATPDQCRHLAMIPPVLAPRIAITFRSTAVEQETRVVQPEPRTRWQAKSRTPKSQTTRALRRYPARRYVRN